MFRKLLIFFLFISVHSFAQPSDSSNISIVNKKDLTKGVWLTSKWQFQNADPETFSEQKTPSTIAVWHSINLDSIKFISSKVPDFKGTGWFRTYIKNDTSAIQEYMGLLLSQNGASEFFIDGKLINKQGRFSTAKKKAFKPNTRKPLYFVTSDAEFIEFLIKYENNDLLEPDNLDFGKYIGLRLSKPQNIQLLQNNQTQFTVFYSLFFTFFFIHFVFFLFYPTNYSNLFFAIFTLSLGIICFSYVSDQLRATESQGDKLFISFLHVTSLISLSALFNYLFGKSRIRFWLIAGLILISIVTSRVLNFGNNNLVLLITIILVLIETTYLTVKAYKNKVPDTKILIIGMGISILFVIAGSLLIVFFGEEIIGIVGLCILFGTFAILLSITAYLASKIARTNESLARQLHKVEKLSNEKEHILKTQNEFLEHQVNERTAELQLEKQKSDDLLLNILPQEVAEELKNTGKTEAQHYDEVSVLFTDFVSFTSISQKLGVGELIHELNENFTAFDHIMEKHGLEKIKTIGDAYLAVSGLPNKNGKHANAAILAALDILEYVENRKKTSVYGLDIRIGIHSGPLVAGIVGVKKFAFDIWGDTVNTAARMEQNSESGKINISAGTYALVQDAFHFEAREVISVKGKGDMKMYFIKSIKG
jgi:adenylate cyclase